MPQPVVTHNEQVSSEWFEKSSWIDSSSKNLSSQIRFVEQITAGLPKHSTYDFDVAVVYERVIDADAERDRLTKDIAKYEKGVAAAERQLGNEGFLAKAPAQIVEGLKKQEAETRLLLDKARAALANLPPSSAQRET